MGQFQICVGKGNSSHGPWYGRYLGLSNRSYPAHWPIAPHFLVLPIEAAGRLGIRAVSINSTNREDWPALHEEVHNNAADALLISPERLASEDMLLPIAGRIGLLVVDEAHCISDWGHDFRPDYRRLVNILRLMPDNMPILGTTATANDRVVEDVQTQLGHIGVQRGGP